MGNEGSRADAGTAALTKFSAKEKQAIQDLFMTLGGKDKKQLTEAVLTNHLGKWFPASLSKRLFNEMAHFKAMLPLQKQQSYVSEQCFYGSVAFLLSSDVDHIAHMVRHLASTHPNKQLTSRCLHQFVKELLTAYFNLLLKVRGSDIKKVWGSSDPPSDFELEQLTLLSLANLFHPDKKKDKENGTSDSIPDKVYSTDDIVQWIGYSQIFLNAFSCVFKLAFPVCEMSQRTLLPKLLGKQATSDHVNLLSPAAIIALNQAIPHKLREKWTLLFDSRKHGESFTNLLRNVRTYKNIVLVVRDTEGHVFGGFSTAVWSNHAAFQGSIDNFLFSLRPSMKIYTPTGLNTNYFYLNTGQETFPNGMGMGGQLNYFGLWLEVEYGMGHSMAKPLSTTYHNPTLSSQPEFTYTDLEVWRVSNIQEDIEEAEAKAEQRGVTSILDSDPGAKAILEMIGKGNHSDGLRESDPTASNPEETEPPVL